MPMAERTARTGWDDDLACGNGMVSVCSGAFQPFPATSLM